MLANRLKIFHQGELPMDSNDNEVAQSDCEMTFSFENKEASEK